MLRYLNFFAPSFRSAYFWLRPAWRHLLLVARVIAVFIVFNNFVLCLPDSRGIMRLHR